MNSGELSYFLRKNIHTRRTFRGVYARDQLNHIQVPGHKPSSYILNTQPIRIPMGHWIVVYFVPQTDTAIYLDSFGLPPFHREIEQFMKKWASNIIYNKRMLQDIFSSACGFYAMYFVDTLSRGKTLTQLLQPFHPWHTQINDRTVFRRIQHLLS